MTDSNFYPTEFSGVIYKNVPSERVFSSDRHPLRKNPTSWVDDVFERVDSAVTLASAASEPSNGSLKDILGELSETEIIEKDMVHILERIPGKKVNWEHQDHEVVGVLTGGRLVSMPDGSKDALVTFKMHNTGKGKEIVESWNATRGQPKRPMIGLSLAHNWQTMDPDHVAVVDVGRRWGTMVYASAKREEVPVHFIPFPVKDISPASPEMSESSSSSSAGPSVPPPPSQQQQQQQQQQKTLYDIPVANVDATGSLMLQSSSGMAKGSDDVRQQVATALAQERANMEARLKAQYDQQTAKFQEMYDAMRKKERQAEMEEAEKKVAQSQAQSQTQVPNPKKRGHAEAVTTDSGRDPEEKSTTPNAVTPSTFASSGYPDIDSERAQILGSNMAPGAKANLIKFLDQRVAENTKLSKEILDMRMSMVDPEDQDTVRRQTLSELQNRDSESLRATHTLVAASKRKFDSLERAAADKAAAAAAAAASAVVNHQAIAAATAAMNKNASSQLNKDVQPTVSQTPATASSSAATTGPVTGFSAPIPASNIIATSNGLNYNSNFVSDMIKATNGGDLSQLADTAKMPLIMASNMMSSSAKAARDYVGILEAISARTLGARIVTKSNKDSQMVSPFAFVNRV